VKRLDQVLDIGPKYGERFERNGIRTLTDLARSHDLPDLSLRTEIPAELVQQWHTLAVQKIKAARYRHAIGALIAAVVVAALGFEFRTFFRSPDIASQGDALYDQGRYEEALARYNKAIELNPNSGIAYGGRGSALRMLGRYPEALAALNKAIELNPRFVGAYNERGAVYSGLEKYKQAVADHDKVIELDPGNKYAYGLKGSALQMLKDYPAALAALNKAIALSPQYVWAYNERASVYSDEKKYEKAISDYNKALELDPTYKFAYGKAFDLRKLKRYEEALDALNQAIVIDPQWSWPYEERGSLRHDVLFQYEAAYQDLKKVSELNDSSDAGDKLDREANLAEAALTAGRFPEAYELATKVLLESQNAAARIFGASQRCAVRLIAISALLLQQDTAQAKLRLEEFIQYYKSVAPGLERRWDYAGTQHFIAGWSMDGSSKRVILDLIKLLQAQSQVKIERIEKLVATL